MTYPGPGAIPADHAAAMAAARRRIGRHGTAAVFDPAVTALSRGARQLAVPVAITCGDCGTVCLDSGGAERTTSDRAQRVDFCDGCKLGHATGAVAQLLPGPLR